MPFSKLLNGYFALGLIISIDTVDNPIMSLLSFQSLFFSDLKQNTSVKDILILLIQE